MNKLMESLAAQEVGKILMIGVALTAFYWFSVYDDGSAIDMQAAQITESLQAEEVKKKETDATLNQVKEMQEKVGQLSQKYQEISRRLPEALYSIDINRSIDDFARNAGVSVKMKKPGENIKREVVEEVPVEVQLEGTYAELAQFTYLVSRAERMARTKNVIITGSDDGKKRLKFEGQVVGYKLSADPNKTEKPQ